MQKIMEAAKKQIDGLLAEKDMVIMAIDGKCTSGKTTLASKLAEIYDCTDVFTEIVGLRAFTNAIFSVYRGESILQPLFCRNWACRTRTAFNRM